GGLRPPGGRRRAGAAPAAGEICRRQEAAPGEPPRPAAAMLANQNLMIQVMEMSHGNIGSVLALVSKACGKLGLEDVGAECEQTREALKDMESMFATLRDASTGDLSKVLDDVKKRARQPLRPQRRGGRGP
ncbi:unnamed protein product, partial [Prorocentrum cordatum]